MASKYSIQGGLGAPSQDQLDGVCEDGGIGSLISPRRGKGRGRKEGEYARRGMSMMMRACKQGAGNGGERGHEQKKKEEKEAGLCCLLRLLELLTEER